MIEDLFERSEATNDILDRFLVSLPKEHQAYTVPRANPTWLRCFRWRSRVAVYNRFRQSWPQWNANEATGVT